MAVSVKELQHAKEGFARLMQLARERPLTDHERKMLSRFRQTLRREKRPAMNPNEKLIIIVWVDENGKPYAALWKARGTDKDVAKAESYASEQNGRVFVFPTKKSLTDAKREAIRDFLSPYPRGAEYLNPRKLTRSKARSILHEGKVRGRKITPRQRRFFGARASGYPKRNVDVMTPKDWKRAILLYKRYKTETIEYKALERKAGGNLNSKIWKILHDKKYGPAKENPSLKSSVQRIGKALEVRYHRTIGRKPGYYKHEIRSRKAGVFAIPQGWIYVKTRSILITEDTPRV